MTDDVGFFTAFLGYGNGADIVVPPPPPIVTVPLKAADRIFFALELDVYQPGTGLPVYAYGRGARPRGSAYLNAVTLESSDTLRASDTGYRTRAADAGGVQVYPSVMDQAFEIDRHISLDPGQASTATFGAIRLSNLGRRYDAYAATRNADGRAVRLLIGSKAWDPVRGIYVDPAYSDMRSFFGGTAQVWSLSETEFEIPIRDATYLADQPIQQNTYGGSGGLAGGSDLTGRRIPMTRGGTAATPVEAISLVTVDAVNLIYQWTDGPGTVVTLYEGGAAVFVYDGDVSDLYSGMRPAGGHYRTNNARGLLQTGSKPVRALTVDATGAFLLAGAVGTAVALARNVLTETLAQPSSILDLPSFSAADTAYPYVSGFWLADDTTALSVVQLLLNSIGARLISTRTGLLSVLVLRKPYANAAPAMRLSRTNVIDVQPVALPSTLDPPPYRQRVGYGHINSVQTSDFNGSITDARKAQVGAAYAYAGWSSSAVLTAWRRRTDPDPVPTALLVKSDAQELATAIGSLFETRPGQFTVEMPIALAASLDLGSVVLLDWPLADLAGGKIGLIIGEQVRSYDASVTFTVLATGTGSPVVRATSVAIPDFQVGRDPVGP